MTKGIVLTELELESDLLGPRIDEIPQKYLEIYGAPSTGRTMIIGSISRPVRITPGLT